jgi:hypothetical protein
MHQEFGGMYRFEHSRGPIWEIMGVDLEAKIRSSKTLTGAPRPCSIGLSR